MSDSSKRIAVSDSSKRISASHAPRAVDAELQSIANAAVPDADAGESPEVRVLDQTLRDEARARDIPLRIYLPADGSQADAPFPTIVFSHGLGGSRLTYAPLARAWVKNGFAVVLPSHFGSDAGIFRQKKRPTEAMCDALANLDNWDNRPRDISFVIDALGSEAISSPHGLRGMFDLSRLGLGGHSFGAWTTAAVAGAQVVFPNETEPRPYADSRPRAFVVMSPTEYGQRGVNEGGWKSIARPLMTLTGTQDRTLSGGSYEARTLPFRDLSPGDKWLVVIEGAEHLSFSGGTIGNKVSAPMQRVIEESTLAFWELELKGDERARALLQPAALENDGIKVHIETR